MSQSKAIAQQREDKTTVVVQQAGKQSWWTSLTPGQRKIITSTAIALGISVIAVAAFYFGNKIIKEKVASHEQSKSLGEDQHATWAKQISNAFINDYKPGTNEPLLRKTLREIPSREDFEKVSDSYRRMTEGKELVSDMTGELSQTEYTEMLAIIKSKPEKAKDAKKGVAVYDPKGWAQRINAAVNYQTWGMFWGTDIDAIDAVVLEIPTQQAFLDTAKEYEIEYGVKIMDDLGGDLSAEEMNKYRRMVLSKPRK
ncbi:MAG: hypothetical protein HYZ14_03055 [Bacteroidetes bacterium]|nr:hypothetical protein [Bacteroidota bacterium]